MGRSTTTFIVALPVFPDLSVAVNVTVVVPIWNSEPERGLEAMSVPGQLSTLRGCRKETRTPAFAVAMRVIALKVAGTRGACLSRTTTVIVSSDADAGFCFT